MIDRTYVLAALIVLAAAIILALIGVVMIRRFRASRWAEYDISLTDRLERALGTGLPPLKVEPRAAAPSVQIATVVVPNAAVEASTADVDVPRAAPVLPTPAAPPVSPVPPVPPVPPADLTTAAGEVWFAPEPAREDVPSAMSPARPRSKKPVADPSHAPEESSAPDYELSAPVELRFAGDSGIVGIRADTETAAAFRRMADELTEGIDNDES